MSRGLGVIQRKALAICTAQPRNWFSLRQIAAGVYGVRWITSSEYESVRRAMRSLARKYLVSEVGWLISENGEALYGAPELENLILEKFAEIAERQARPASNI